MINPQPPLARELASVLERALNREIAESTAASDLLAELDGETFAIDVRGLGVRCVLRASGSHVSVEPWWLAAAQTRPPATTTVSAATPPSATLTASPFDL